MRSRTIYIITVLFLLSTNVATIISISAKRNSSEEKEDIAPGRQPAESRMSFFWGELGLNEEQRSDAIKFNNDYNSKARKITEDLTDLRHQIVEEMASDRPDRDELDSIIQEFGKRHSELKRETVDFYYQLYSLCDTNQRKRLEYMFRDMLDPDGMVYGRGRGGQGRGRQFLEEGSGAGQGRGRGPGRGWGRDGNRQKTY